MWGQILGALVGPVTEGMSSAAQYQASKHERNISWKRAKWWAVNEPSLRMAGLRQAGLNPALAAGGGFGGRGVSSPDMASTGGKPSFSGSNPYAEGVASAKAVRLLDAQVAEAKARARIAENEAAASLYLPWKAYNEAGTMGERWGNVQEHSQFLRTQRGLLEANTARAVLETRLRGYDEPAAKAVAELYKSSPELRQGGAAASEIGKIIGSFLGGRGIGRR